MQSPAHQYHNGCLVTDDSPDRHEPGILEILGIHSKAEPTHSALYETFPVHFSP